MGPAESAKLGLAGVNRNRLEVFCLFCSVEWESGVPDTCLAAVSSLGMGMGLSFSGTILVAPVIDILAVVGEGACTGGCGFRIDAVANDGLSGSVRGSM